MNNYNGQTIDKFKKKTLRLSVNRSYKDQQIKYYIRKYINKQ